MPRGIFSKLLYLTMATVLPFVALATGLLWDQWQREQSAALREVWAQSQAVASEIDNQLSNFQTLLTALGHSLSLDPADTASNDAKLRRMKAEFPQYLGAISNILLFGPDGNNIGTSMEGRPTRIFVGDRDYFKAALAGDHFVIGEPVLGRHTGQWVVPLARPIYGEAGQVNAILVTGIEATHFQHALDLSNLPPGSVMRVVSPRGTLVARSAKAEFRVGRATRVFQPGAFANVKWGDGVSRITGTTETSIAPWTVSVGVPNDIGLANVQTRLIAGVVVAVLALLTAFSLAWFLAARLTRPLAQLTADAKVLTGGDLTHRTNVSARGEVAVLARAFNAMVDSLEQRHNELEMMRKATSIEAAERKRVQELERQSKEVLAAIIDTSPVGIVCTGIDRRTTLWSRAAERIYGYTAEETLGEFTKIIPPGGIEHSASLLQRALRGESVRHVETKRRRKDGTLIDVEVSASALYAPDGSVRGVAWAHNDVTRRKEAERQLAQSQKMEAIGQLTGGIAHDLNNLLLVIIGNLDLLHEKHSQDTESEELIAASLGAATSGADLANGLLGFSRKQALQPELIETKSLVFDHIGFLKRLLGPTIAVTTELADDTFPVHADPTQLRCALMNLVVNARDAMPGGGTLTVRTYNTVLPQAELAAWVSAQSGRLYHDRGLRHGRWHITEEHAADLRAILHHQGRRQGNRPRPQHGVWILPAVEGHGRRRKRGRSRDDFPRLPPARGRGALSQPPTCRSPCRAPRARANSGRRRRRTGPKGRRQTP